MKSEVRKNSDSAIEILGGGTAGGISKIFSKKWRRQQNLEEKKPEVRKKVNFLNYR